MENEISQEQIEELQRQIENSEPVAVSMHMHKSGFEFIVNSLRILNHEKYKEEQGIVFVNKHSTLGKYCARVIYSDDSSKIISLREEK
jgi:hypothetical protein